MVTLNRKRSSGPLLWFTKSGQLVRARDCPHGAIPAFNRHLIGRGYYVITRTDSDAVIAWKRRANRLLRMLTALKGAAPLPSLRKNQE